MSEPMALIPLRRRNGPMAATLVDAADAEWLSTWRWHSNTDGYASRCERVSGKVHGTNMARAILGLVKGDPRHVDHINRDKLDNRRANLRAVEQRLNQQNRPACAGSTSPFKNVAWSKQQRRWHARLTVDGHGYHLGYFAEELDAARAVENFRRVNTPHVTPDPILMEVV